MTPPEGPVAGKTAEAADGSPAVLSCLTILQKRADFLRVASARRQGATGFLLQARRRRDDETAAGIRVGFTCSKKVGNAVARNRAKRRLRALAREVIAAKGREGWDYVLVGRPGVTVDRPYGLLLADLDAAMDRIHAERDAKAPRT